MSNFFFWNRWRDKFCTILGHTILGHRIAILRMRTREEEKKPPQFPVEINGLINYKTKLNTQYLDSLLSRFVCSKIEIIFVIFIYIASIRWELTPSLPVVTVSHYSQVYRNPYITKFILKKRNAHKLGKSCISYPQNIMFLYNKKSYIYYAILYSLKKKIKLKKASSCMICNL